MWTRIPQRPTGGEADAWRSLGPTLAILLVALAIALPSGAQCSTLRIALVVGSNEGTSGPPLRFAEHDADRVAKVLVTLGGMSPTDVIVLKGADNATVDDALGLLKQRLEEQAVAGASSVFLFYYSGHADGLNLELGKDLYPFASLKATIAAMPADSKVVVLDACGSGNASEVKGGTAGPSFAIPLEVGELPTGMAFITSSSPGEKAQESAELGSGYFTHHWVSGLYGAADTDGDGKVGLLESFSFASTHTVASTAKTIAGPQHPTFRYDLGGTADLVLTGATAAGGALSFGADVAGTFFVMEEGAEVVVELTKAAGEEKRVNLLPGSYSLLMKRATGLWGKEVVVEVGATLAVIPSELTAVEASSSLFKGSEGRTVLFGGYAMGGWLMPEMGVLHGGSLGVLYSFDLLTVSARLGFGLATVEEQGLVYDLSTFSARLSLLVRIQLPVVDLLFGPSFGGAYMRQEVDVLETDYSSGRFDGSLTGALDIHLIKGLALLVSWELTVYAFISDGAMEVSVGPEAMLALGWRF